jgi:parvulin-like peptidyl-prolyl isomerase
MIHLFNKCFPAILIIPGFALLLGACTDTTAETAAGKSIDAAPAVTATADTPAAQEQGDVIARVGDQTITFNQLSTMLNSSAVVGLSLPALGTPERDVVRITLLDKVISANLLYLDAVDKGLDKDPQYQRDLKTFADGILTGLYQQEIIVGDIEPGADEIQAFYKNNIAPGTEFTDEVQATIRATLRKQRLQQGLATRSQQVREGVTVTVNEEELDPDDDEVQHDTEVVATVDDQAIVWGEVKGLLGTPLNAGSMANRLKALNTFIDNRIMARKARAAGMEQHPLFLLRYNEFKKVRLINNHRAGLVHGMLPTDEEIRDYYDNNKDKVVLKEQRRVQTVVLKTREEAEDVKRKIEQAEITISQAAAQYSIGPDAGRTLGRLGWVKQGTGYPNLDALAFSLEIGIVGGPVETPSGWQLLKVMEVRDAVYTDIEDEGTQKAVRRLILDERLDDYVVNLREDKFQVAIYDKKLSELSQKEIEWFEAKRATGEKSPEEIQKILEELNATR